MEIQNWIFDLIGSQADPHSLSRSIIPKLPHVILFGLLGYVAAREMRDGLRWWLLAASIGVAVGAEILQRYTHTRSFATLDLAINLASVNTLFWVAVLVRNRVQQTTDP